MKLSPAFIMLLMLVSCVCSPLASGSQSPENAQTSGLTSVVTERDDNVFTWTVINNTGPGDGQPEWDVLIWSVIPDNVPRPVRVETPAGWEWVDKGNQGQFLIEMPSEKYESGPAIAPGQSAVFKFAYDPFTPNVENPTFTMHVGAVLPEPLLVDGKTTWTPTSIDNRASWFDQPSSRETRSTPEPRGLLAGLVWCGGIVALSKRMRPRKGVGG